MYITTNYIKLYNLYISIPNKQICPRICDAEQKLATFMGKAMLETRAPKGVHNVQTMFLCGFHPFYP